VKNTAYPQLGRSWLHAIWPGISLAVAAVLAAATPAGAAGPYGPATAPERDTAKVLLQPIAVFGADDRTLLPARMSALEDKIGMLYEPRSRSVCTAFCIREDTVATAAHCLFRTRGERPLPLANVTFRLSSMGGRRGAGVKIAGAAQGAADQNVITGTTSLSTKPPIDATRDWALIRLASPVCKKGGLPLVRRTPAELSAVDGERTLYQVGYHGDFGKWRLTLSPPCTVRRLGRNAGGRMIAGDFADASALILHTCDTGGASSGSPLLVDGPRGPEVVGINVGTYLQSHVLTQDGEVLHRYRSDTVANTGVSTLAFMEQRDSFAVAEVITSRQDIRRMQRGLASAGHYEGPLDGLYGPALRAAIERFETAERRPRTGLASTALLRRLEAVIAERTGAPAYEPTSDRLETGSVPRPQPARR
jgi:protease YdgD